MESVPLSQSHHIVINFFVEVVQQSDGLDNHGVDLIDGELQLESTEPMSETEGHALLFVFS